MKKKGIFFHAFKLLGWLAPFLAVLALFYGFFHWDFLVRLLTLEERGQFGDSFGALTSLFTGLGFAGLVVTLMLQQSQIKLQSREIQQQSLDIKTRRYEDVLFQAHSIYQEALDSVIITKDGKSYQGRDALKHLTDKLIKDVRLQKVNTIPQGLQTRLEKNKMTTDDLQLLDYLYYKNFRLLSHSCFKQGRLTEAFKVLLSHLEDGKPTDCDNSVFKRMVLSDITYIEVTYFFYVALGHQEETELRDLLSRCDFLEKIAHVRKLKIHLLMYSKFWGIDIRSYKKQMQFPFTKKDIRKIKRSEQKMRSKL